MFKILFKNDLGQIVLAFDQSFSKILEKGNSNYTT